MKLKSSEANLNGLLKLQLTEDALKNIDFHVRGGKKTFFLGKWLVILNRSVYVRN